MEEISLQIMSRELCQELFNDWQNDPEIYMDREQFTIYQYNENTVNKYFDKKQTKDCVLLAIMKGNKPIGEIQLKNIDWYAKECTLSIHLQNNAVKGRGYGTCAEKLALKYAFNNIKMMAVNADTISSNKRSQHVLEKVGFQFVKEENGFRYYRCELKTFYKANQ